jgi:IclR family transcriptional regulator, acetate operon repressor
MAVQKNLSAELVIKVLENVAEHQPVGVGDLSKIMGGTKSSLQRALVTLAECKWIRMTHEKPTRWELSERIHMIAYLGQTHSDLANRARPPLEALRQETGETVVLMVPGDQRFVSIAAFESRQAVRTSAAVGMTAPVRGSASGLAVLAYLDKDGQISLLGEVPSAALRKQLEQVRKQGYAVNDETLVTGSTSIGAAVFDSGRPVAVVLIAGPSKRIPKSIQPKIGTLVAKTASLLSRGPRV